MIKLASRYMPWQSKNLIFGGTCESCRRRIAKDGFGWHNFQTKKVRCVECGPPVEVDVAPTSDTHSEMRPDPVGGSAALREAQNQRDQNWLRGATGEYRMDRLLHELLNDSVVVLTDRRVPGTQANIDHIVIAPSGVWIIDSKNWSGTIRYKSASSMSANMRLFVDGEDRTSKVEAIYGLVIPIAQVIADKSVTIHPAVAFIDGEWSLAAIPRLLRNRPYQHGGVWITPPRMLIKKINQPGPLDAQTVIRISKMLDEALKPR